ncbi:membrane protein [Collibacillus ludicampi]|uniref:Membrane protein n=1 Tax=Collibacillus ludicampi TaxID=2771369 RepID=A0AAV4LAW6_9BACL|nr:DUF485 domain-containing protein [Collibacillus ludicampi]GIM44788.1 membrane protein [Collibacillus ludicampi]
MKTNLHTGVNASIPDSENIRPASTGEWERIVHSSAFQELIRKKRAFIIPAMIFFMVFYFVLPILTAFTTVLNKKAIGAINWAYLYAFAQFIMTWGLSHLYMKKANQFDELSERVKREAAQKGEKVQ